MSTTERLLIPEKVAALTISPSVVAEVKGNASYALKKTCIALIQVLLSHERGATFAKAVAERIRVTEVSFVENPEQPGKTEARVVCEVEVTEDMLDVSGNLQAGCMVFLVDLCSGLPLTVSLEIQPNQSGYSGVSQSINTAFHSPIPLGTKLKIVNVTMVGEGEVLCATSQIWDAENAKLLASGIQTKMMPSPAKMRL